MFTPITLSALAALATRAVSSPVHVPLNVSTVIKLGLVTDNSSNPGIYHDGGGGGTQGGYHLQVFADSQTNSSGFNMAHNSLAYLGYRNASDPTNLYTFGMKGTAGNKIFTGPAFGPLPNSNESALGVNFAIWALGNLAALPDNKTAVGVFPALYESQSGNHDLYSTMVTIEAVDPSTVAAGAYPPIKRIAPQLFYPGEVNYGTLATYVGDNYLYLLGNDDTGIKLARVAATIGQIADRTQYSYFNGSSQTWGSQAMKANDNTTNIISWTSDFLGTILHPSSGDLFFSNYHNTYIIVFSDSGVDGVFRASYSTSGNISGPWSTPTKIYSPPLPAACPPNTWDYQAHVHYGVDPSGKTLLLSYSSCTVLVSMARLYWA